MSRSLVLWFISYVALVVGAAGVPAFADSGELAATEVAVDFNAMRAEPGPKVCVGALPGDQCAYMLKLIPDYDAQTDIAALELKLVQSTNIDDPDADNLLAPYSWHGMQKFFFAASDLAQGPSQTLYGQRRTIVVPQRKFSIEITIESARVAQVAALESEFPYSIDELKLRVVFRPTR